MKLLYVSPPDEASASVLAALHRHPELSIATASGAQAACKAAQQETPDAVMMPHHPNAAHWVAELTSSGWSGPTVLLLQAEGPDDLASLTRSHDVVCLTPEATELRSFPALLRRLVQPAAPQGPDPLEALDRSLTTLTHERDQLKALASIDQQILAMSDSPHLVIKTALGHAIRLLQLPSGISVLAPYTQWPELIHTHGIKHGDQITELIRTNWTRDSRWYEQQGPNWHLAVSDVAATSSHFQAWMQRERIKAVLVIPLWLQGRLVGLLGLFDMQTRDWQEEEIHIAAMLASQATIAMDKAILTQQLRLRLRQAEEAVAQLQRFDELKRQFIQNVSHELRTPLAIVKGYVDLIASGNLGEQHDPLLNQAIEAIHTHTNNLVQLVESITALGDMEIGKLHLASQPVQPICEAAVRAIWQQALRRDITIRVEISETLPEIELDAQGFLRALNHVLDNAVKFSPEGSEIHFESFADDGAVWFRIEDQGIGIAPGELDRIFDRFYQIHGESTRRYGGMGIGLSVVKEVVQAHHGEVWAESRGEGHGTTISIKLPVRPPVTARPPIGAAA